MKFNLKIGLPIIAAIMVAVTALAFTPTSQNTNDDPTELVYFKYDELTQELIPIDPNSPQASPLPNSSNPYGCSGGNEICSRGYAEEDLMIDDNGYLVPQPEAQVYDEHSRN